MGPPLNGTKKGTRKAAKKPAKETAPGPAPGRQADGGAYHPQVQAILDVIRSIPRGRTAAYGQVAALAGQPRGARQVARVLHSLSESQALPWHRVINGNGRISLPMDGPGGFQAALLRGEGVAVDAGGRVDTAVSSWRPRTRRGPA